MNKNKLFLTLLSVICLGSFTTERGAQAAMAKASAINSSLSIPDVAKLIQIQQQHPACIKLEKLHQLMNKLELHRRRKIVQTIGAGIFCVSALAYLWYRHQASHYEKLSEQEGDRKVRLENYYFYDKYSWRQSVSRDFSFIGALIWGTGTLALALEK